MSENGEYSKLLRQRISKYENTYMGDTKKIAQKLIFWNLRWMFLGGGKHKQSSEKTLRIAIKLNGGVGDVLMQSTYVKELVKYINANDIHIDLFCFKDKETPKAVFYNAMYIENVFPLQQYSQKRKRYTLTLNIQRFVMIDYIDWNRVKQHSDALFNYCQKIQDFYNDNRFMINNSPYSDTASTQLTLLKGKNRISQTDILNIVGLSNNPVNFLDLNPDYFDILSKLDLLDKKFITIQRGINHNSKKKENVRNWPLSHYEKLISDLKKHYPDIQIVQMGYSEGNCEQINGVDIDLRGKTNFEELKVLLKYALLHIDSEGGYTHIRHFLNTRSVVLFGPTDINFFGYPDNINIKSEACPIACEWVTENWIENCIRGFEKPPCMYEITPEEVFLKVKQYFDSLPYFLYIIKKNITSEKISNILNSYCSTQYNCATINIEIIPEEITNQENITLLGLNKEKKANIEYSGNYNVSAKDQSLDLIIAAINEKEKHPEFVILDLLRVLKAGRLLILKHNDNNLNTLNTVGISITEISPTSENNSFWIIEKTQKNND